MIFVGFQVHQTLSLSVWALIFIIDYVHFEQMVDWIYPGELPLNKVNSSDTEAPFLDINLSISNGTVSTKIYNKRDDFDILYLPCLDGDVPPLIRFARAYSHVSDFNRAYPENSNFKTCAPSTLKSHILWGLHQIKNCWKFELDILNRPRVIATQKYIEHIMKCW